MLHTSVLRLASCTENRVQVPYHGGTAFIRICQSQATFQLGECGALTVGVVQRTNLELHPNAHDFQ
jgi:hypothetical protein